MVEFNRLPITYTLKQALTLSSSHRVPSTPVSDPERERRGVCLEEQNKVLGPRLPSLPCSLPPISAVHYFQSASSVSILFPVVE